MSNLISEIQSKCAELRDEFIPAYQSIGPAGSLAVALMKSAIKTAEDAIANGDTVQMVSSLQELRDFKM